MALYEGGAILTKAYGTSALGSVCGVIVLKRKPGEGAAVFSVRALVSFVFGAAFAHFVGGAIVEYFSLAEATGDGAKFLSGVFGLSAVSTIIERLPAIMDSVAEVIVARLKK